MIEIIINIIIGGAVHNDAVTVTVVGVPVVPRVAVTRCALALAGVLVPVVVCWAHLGAADAFADNVAKNEAIVTVGGFALACALFGVKVLGRLASIVHVALASAGLGVPVLIGGTFIVRSTNAATDSCVKVMGGGAVLRFAKAAAHFFAEVPASWALTLLADAFTKVLAPFFALVSTLLGFTDAGTSIVVPEFIARTWLNDALTLARGNVPGPGVWISSTFFRWTDTFTSKAVPDVSGIGTVVRLKAITLAVVEVPVLIVGAIAFHAAALTGKCVKFFVLIFTFTHFVPARAVAVLIKCRSVDELAGWAHNQSWWFNRIAESIINPGFTRFKDTRDESYGVLGLRLCKSVSILVILSFKG